MNQNEREGQSMGRTTGASGQDAEDQQDRTIEGQESEPGTRYTGQGDTTVGGGTGGTGGTGGSQAGGGWQGGGHGGDSLPQGETNVAGGTNVGGGTSGESSGRSPQGPYGDQAGTGSGPEADAANEEMDESQWQGNRFSQGGSLGNTGGGSNS